MQNKKAMLVISFGTSIKEARISIQNIEDYLDKGFKDHDLYRAFTSRIIINKLKERDGKIVYFPDEALDKLLRLGYEEVICQPLNIINGIEYELTRKIINSYKNRFKKIIIGAPLLNSLDDYLNIAEMYRGVSQENEAVLLMGHGTVHHSNSAYSMLEDVLRYSGINNVYVATVEGFPDIEYAIHKLKANAVKSVTLMPFMIVAGDHAINDMAGDEEDSWKNILLNEGFDVNCVLKGLGDYEEIQNIFCEHLKAATDRELNNAQKHK